jgi:hypothetical protein
MNEKGDNVTFSPRSSIANYEPKHNPDFKYEVLPGTGIFDGHMVFSGHCTSGCQNWPGGYMDVSSDNQKGCYAAGPAEGFQSNDPAASIVYHASYGSFKIDMKRTFGHADAPVIDDTSTNSGTELDEDGGGGKWDKKSIFHGVIMVFVFIAMMPFGVVLIRVGHWVRWHAVNQTLAMIIAMGGMGLGIATSLLYQRSRSFTTPHQLIGFVVIASLMAQFTLGFLHHKAYKKTQKTTKMAPVHVWLGRIVIILATVNAFLYVKKVGFEADENELTFHSGFPLARKPRRAYILAGVVVLVFGVIIFLLVGRGLLDRLMGKRHAPKAPEGTRGYDPEPWRHADTGGSGAYGGYQGKREYSPGPPQNISLMDVGSRSGSRNEMRGDLGGEQRPREFA